VGEKGHNETLGKSGKRYLKEFPYPVGECESPAGAAAEPPRCRKIDRSPRSRRTAHALVNPAGTTTTPLRYRKIDRSPRSRRTVHALVNPAGAAVRPLHIEATVARRRVEGIRE
jgi:hypothetical protein